MISDTSSSEIKGFIFRDQRKRAKYGRSVFRVDMRR